MKDYLKQFQFPEDLKDMDFDELELLSYDHNYNILIL